MTIEVKDVKKSYDGKVVLEDFNLNIESEHSYIITGPSGCGKTTLLRLILGLEKPDAGTVKLLGDYKYPFINSGTVFQEDRLCEEYDAVTNVTMVSRKVFKETVTEELLKLLPEEAIHKPVKELSGGQKRRVAIVRACAIPSDILIMDEHLVVFFIIRPTKNIKSNTRQFFNSNIIKEYIALCIFISTKPEFQINFCINQSITFYKE